MGNVKQQVTISGLRGEKKVIALVDSGAENSAIRSDIATEIGASVIGEIEIEGITGGKIIAETVIVRLEIMNRFSSIEVAVLNMKEPFIVGVDFLQEKEAQLDFSKDKLRFNEHAPKVRKIYRI